MGANTSTTAITHGISRSVMQEILDKFKKVAEIQDGPLKVKETRTIKSDGKEEIDRQINLQINPQTIFSAFDRQGNTSIQLNHFYKKDFDFSWDKLFLIQSTGISATDRATLLRSETMVGYRGKYTSSTVTLTNLLNQQGSHTHFDMGGSGRTVWDNISGNEVPTTSNWPQPLSPLLSNNITLGAESSLGRPVGGKNGMVPFFHGELELSIQPRFEPVTGKLTFGLTDGKKNIKSILACISYTKGNILSLDLETNMNRSELTLLLGMKHTPAGYQWKTGVEKQFNDRGSIAVYAGVGPHSQSAGFFLKWKFGK